MSEFRLHLNRLIPWVGSSGSAFGGFAMLCCFGWTGLASFLPLIGLGFLVRFTVALKLVWISLGITAIGLTLSFTRHRRPWPLVTAALGAGLLIYPMYHALEVWLWLALLYSGLSGLFLGTAFDLWLSIRRARQCAIPMRRPDQDQRGSTRMVGEHRA